MTKLNSSTSLSEKELELYKLFLNSIRSKDLHTVKMLLEQNPNFTFMIDDNVYFGGIKGNTPLLHAIAVKAHVIAEYLISKSLHKEELNYSNSNPLLSNTALTLAIKMGQIELAIKLLEHKNIDVNFKCHVGEFTALHLAIFKYSYDVANAESHEKRHKLFNSNYDSLIKKLIKAGADIEAKDQFGNVPSYYFNKDLEDDDFKFIKIINNPLGSQIAKLHGFEVNKTYNIMENYNTFSFLLELQKKNPPPFIMFQAKLIDTLPGAIEESFWQHCLQFYEGIQKRHEYIELSKNFNSSDYSKKVDIMEVEATTITEKIQILKIDIQKQLEDEWKLKVSEDTLENWDLNHIPDSQKVNDDDYVKISGETSL